MVIMIDLETLSIKQGGIILSIGAVVMDKTGEFVDEYFATMPLKESLERFKLDSDTFCWWLDEERLGTFKELLFKCQIQKTSITHILQGFAEFCKSYEGGDEGHTTFWGNSAAFDLGLLGAYYELSCLKIPWKFYHERCFRTEKARWKDLEPPRAGTHHDALDDARHQANWLYEINTHIERLIANYELAQNYKQSEGMKPNEGINTTNENIFKD